MKIFLIRNKMGEIVTSKNNKEGVYVRLKGAKTGLRQHLMKVNKRIKDKNLQEKSENYTIVEYDIVQKDIHRL